tara:strand:- start:4 stop:255 length:252 start_codon:yes stop_codon:yes gene_type:complete
LKVTRKIREFVSTVDIDSMGYVDLNNCMGEVRLLLARLSVEKEGRLNERAAEEARAIHKDEVSERDRFNAHVRKVVEGKKTHG